MSKGDLISEGARSRVYRWGATDVVKILDVGISQEEAQREAEATRVAQSAGLPVPMVRDVIAIEGAWGLVFEYVVGQPLDEYAAENPGLMQEMAMRMASLHQAVHKVKAPQLRTVDEWLRTRIMGLELPEDALKDRALRTLDDLEDGDTLLHCDLHPNNLLVDDRGELYLIDWCNACAGHPWADVMRSYLILHLAKTSLPRDMLWLPEGFKTFYIENYLDDDTDLLPRVMKWLLPVALARMSEGFVHEEAELHKLLRGQEDM